MTLSPFAYCATIIAACAVSFELGRGHEIRKLFGAAKAFSDLSKSCEKRAMQTHDLILAAQALLTENTETAVASYAVPGEPLTDENWLMEDERHARLCIKLRCALKAIAPYLPLTDRNLLSI